MACKETDYPIGVCVKITALRPRYQNLKQWCSVTENVLVTRHGRVFIHENGTKYIFTYKGEWANPFKLSEYTLDESLERYASYLDELLKDPQCLQRFLLLRQANEIGCFCGTNDRCHRDIILKKLKELLPEK